MSNQDPYGWNASIGAPPGGWANGGGGLTSTDLGALQVTPPPGAAPIASGDVNPYKFGGYGRGAADYSGRYTGLAGTLARYGAGMSSQLRQGYLNRGADIYGAATSLGADLAARDRLAANASAGRLQQTGGFFSSRDLAQARDAQMRAGLAGNLAGEGLGLEREAALGRAPSAAEIQMKQGVAGAMRAQLTAAASARGGAGAQAAAGEQAAIQGAQMQGQAVGDAAALRAKEMADARQAYETGAANLYGTAGGLGQGYQGMAGTIGLTAEEQAGGITMQGRQLAQGAALQGEQLGQQGQLGFGALAENAGQFYSGLGVNAQQTYEQMNQDMLNRQRDAAMQQYAVSQGIALQQQQLQNQKDQQIIGGVGSAAAAVAPLLAASDERLKSAAIPQGDASPGSGMAVAAPPPSISHAAILGQIKAGRASGRPLNPQPYPPAGPMVSDERAKARVSPAPVADAFLSQLDKSKSTFAYKSPADQPLSPMHPHVPGARFGGVMAQDLERVPEIGPQLVTDTPRGKQIEPAAGLSAVMMGMGRLEERMRALEGKRGGKRV